MIADNDRATGLTALPSNVGLKTNPPRSGFREADFSGVDRARPGAELWRGARPHDPVSKAMLDDDDD